MLKRHIYILMTRRRILASTLALVHPVIFCIHALMIMQVEGQSNQA
jgi:hypothetical protein